MISEYKFAAGEWTYELQNFEYGTSVVVFMKNKYFPGMEYCFDLDKNQTSVSNLDGHLRQQAYFRHADALLFFKLRTIGELNES